MPALMRQICDAVAAQVATAPIDRGGDVTVRTLPQAHEQFDLLPAVMVCPAGSPRRLEPLAFESFREFGYPVHVVVLAAANQDIGVEVLDEWEGWLHGLADRLDLDGELAGVGEVTALETTEYRGADQALQGLNYAHVSITLEFRAHAQVGGVV